ncbi:MAG: glycosyltransferase family 2 protein [Thermoplasmatales archaeon]
MAYITVILIAFNRTEYLVESLHSVLNQTLDRENYEIIVVKNFIWDSEPLLAKNKVKVIFDGQEKIGPKLSSALEASSGEVICFLDDDDVFKPNKLMEIYDTFIHNESLGYLKNNFEIIDEKGAVRESKLFKNARSEMEVNGPQVVLSTNKVKDFKILSKFSFDALPSTICVRKRILLANKAYLIDLDLSQDWFSFYATLISDYSMMVDSRVMTSYRIHGKSTSGSSGELSCAKLGEFYFRLGRSYQTILQMVESKGIKFYIDKIINNIHYYKIRSDILTDKGASIGIRQLVRYILLPELFMYRSNSIKFIIESLRSIFVINYFVINPTKGLESLRKKILKDYKYGFV